MSEDPGAVAWRDMLTGEDPALRRARRLWRRVPASPRCKVCASPFHGAGGVVARLLWHGPIADNPLLCKACFGRLSNSTGGAEVEISVVFADVRGSTALAERTSPADFRALLQDYYRTAAAAVDANGGIVDKFLGDGVMSLFIPVIAGANHSERAIAAGQALLTGVRQNGLVERGLAVGAGVHSGIAFVGIVGRDATADFSAVGDTVNVAARLGAAAGPDELLVSHAAWERAGRPEPASVRSVEIAGRSEGMPVVSLLGEAGMPGAATSAPG